MNIKIIHQLKDNYSYILFDKTKDSFVIDPAESRPIIEFIKINNLKLKDVFITHHHKDHTAGVNGILKEFPEVNVHSPSSQIENTRYVLHNNDEVSSSINSFKVIATPGHTLDHIIYFDKNNKILFSGDTLFRLGCGRVFEGTLKDMFLSLQKLNELNNNTIIYCGHEYTLANLKFLENILDKKELYSNIRKRIEDDLNNTGSSVPFVLEEEKVYNLYLNQSSKIAKTIKEELRLTDFELFSFLREKKDTL